MSAEFDNKSIVSVIVPVYNAEEYLKISLDSIAKQDYPYLEVIVINDGSTDSSYDIALSFMKADKRFKIISQSNAGAAAARNKGLSMITGQYVAFVDADDWIDPDYVSTLIRSLQENDADVSMCNFEIEGKLEYNWTEKLMTSTEEIFQEYIHRGCCNRTPNKLYKAELVRDVQFPEGRDVMEDGVWTPRVLRKVNRLYRIPSAKYHIRPVMNSLSRPKKMRGERKLCGYFANMLDRHEVFFEVLKDAESRHLIAQELWKSLDLILSSWCDLSLWDIENKISVMFKSYGDDIQKAADESQQKAMNGILTNVPIKKVMATYVKDRFKSPISVKQKLLLLERILISCIRPA